MPRIGTPPQPIPGIKGLSWLAVEQTSSPPPSLTRSHAHPEPNCVAAAVEKADLKPSNEPKASLNLKVEQSSEKIESIKTYLENLNELLEK